MLLNYVIDGAYTGFVLYHDDQAFWLYDEPTETAIPIVPETVAGASFTAMLDTKESRKLHPLRSIFLGMVWGDDVAGAVEANLPPDIEIEIEYYCITLQFRNGKESVLRCSVDRAHAIYNSLS